MTADPGRGCPKRMTYGPCGGVGPDGSCEIGSEPCVFLDDTIVPWAGAAPVRVPGAAGREFRDLTRRRPVIVAEMPTVPLDVRSIAETADVMRGTVDAVTRETRPRRGCSTRRRIARCWCSSTASRSGPGSTAATATGSRWRGRSPRSPMPAWRPSLRHRGPPESGHRPDAMAVFDLESHELVPLARAAGLLVSVAESPAAPPVAHRAGRLAEKVRAGAQICLLQFCGEVEDVAAFSDAAHESRRGHPRVAGVPVIVDEYGAAIMSSFAAAVLPAGYVESVRGPPIRCRRASRRLCATPGRCSPSRAWRGWCWAVPRAGSGTLLARALAAVGSELGAGR